LLAALERVAHIDQLDKRNVFTKRSLENATSGVLCVYS